VSNWGIKLRRSPTRIDAARRTMTAIENRARSCWNGRLRSTVTKASNSPCAAGEQLTILQCSPACVWHGHHVVSLDVLREAPIDALVEKHPHDVGVIIRAVASSRNATTCSRRTVGNPAKKSSIVSPPSR
jgi:hypothetical protein